MKNNINKKNNDYGLPNKPRKDQIYQSGKLKGNIKYGLLSRVCDAQLECIKDHKVSIDHLLEVNEFLLKQNQEIWKERNRPKEQKLCKNRSGGSILGERKCLSLKQMSKNRGKL